MSRAIAALIGALLVGALGVAPARAYCAPDAIEVDPTRSSAGEEITIDGSHWFVCDDIGAACNGAFEDTDDPPVSPTLFLRFPNGRERVIVEIARTRRDGTFSSVYRLPATLEPGRYVIVAVGNGGVVKATITVEPD